ncbi:MAG: hydrolase [candidate division KSB1 bacterium]|nr:hydrolase [candidate division KSB1 bacterium]MDQ7065362.1 hydrolase [candidate division KSB1 bacterium]
MRIRKDRSAAVVIDIQERLFPHIFEADRLAGNVVKLIEGLKILDIPLMVTEQYSKGLGPTIPTVREALGEFQPLEKMTFSCCGAPSLMTALRNTGCKTVILFGIEAHACVLQTAVDLLEANFVPVVVEDCISSRRLNDKQVAVARMRHEGSIITTYESLLLELCVEAGTDRFKAISKIIK